MSIKQLSFLSGVNCITIHGYETGQTDITLKSINENRFCFRNRYK